MENEFKRVQQYSNYLYGNNAENNRYSSQYNQIGTPSEGNRLYQSAQNPQFTEPNKEYGSGYYNKMNLSPKPSNTHGILRTKHSDITNPDYFSRQSNDYVTYKQRAIDFLSHKTEEEKNKRLHDYFNYIRDDNIFLNVSYLDYLQGKKKIGEISPYNHHDSTLGKSTLSHNTILNPVNNYSYNKYMMRPIRNAGESILKYT